ncbi:MAG: hypothetical protein ACYCUM_14525 [Solirubrobacteraceae bacterium]
MPKKPLAFVTVLAASDYLLWNSSSEGNGAMLAVISGLALVPLLLALLWLVLLTLVRAFIVRTPSSRAQQPPHAQPLQHQQPLDVQDQPAARQHPQPGEIAA